MRLHTLFPNRLMEAEMCFEIEALMDNAIKMDTCAGNDYGTLHCDYGTIGSSSMQLVHRSRFQNKQCLVYGIREIRIVLVRPG